MHTKVVVRGEEPYADFSVLTPFGRRMQKQLRIRIWLPQQDGSYKLVDVPGPPDYNAWFACWKVYRAALHMLRYALPGPNAGGATVIRVVDPASLEGYQENLRTLCQEFPECN